MSYCTLNNNNNNKRAISSLFWGMLTLLHVYNSTRTTARPTADMETSVPMQYFIKSYFAASKWAFNAWISWKFVERDMEKNKRQNNRLKQTISPTLMILTRSSLLVRLDVPALWFESSSLILLQIVIKSHIYYTVPREGYGAKCKQGIAYCNFLPSFKIQI